MSLTRYLKRNYIKSHSLSLKGQETMWAMTTRERKILKKVIPKEFMSKPIQVPNGGETSIEEISKVNLKVLGKK
jgi:hypothetical protein